MGYHFGGVFTRRDTARFRVMAMKTVILWDVETHTNIAALRGHTHAVTSVAFSPTGHCSLPGHGMKQSSCGT